MAKNMEKIIKDIEDGFKVEPVDGNRNFYAVKHFNKFSGFKWQEDARLEFNEDKKSWFIITDSLGHGINAKTDTHTSDLREAVHQLAVETAHYRNAHF